MTCSAPMGNRMAGSRNHSLAQYLLLPLREKQIKKLQSESITAFSDEHEHAHIRLDQFGDHQ